MATATHTRHTTSRGYILAYTNEQPDSHIGVDVDVDDL